MLHDLQVKQAFYESFSFCWRESFDIIKLLSGTICNVPTTSDVFSVANRACQFLRPKLQYVAKTNHRDLQFGLL